jgi:hypothetical protein
MVVLKVSYKAKDSKVSTMFNHTILGRYVSKNKRGKKVAYYSPGVLDNVFFKKEKRNELLICKEYLPRYYTDNNCEKFLELIGVFGTVKIEEIEMDTTEFITGRTYWKNILEKRGDTYAFIDRKKKH